MLAVQALLVYKGPTLAWAAKLDTQPVAVRVADIGGNKGMIVTLDDAGENMHSCCMCGYSHATNHLYSSTCDVFGVCSQLQIIFLQSTSE